MFKSFHRILSSYDKLIQKNPRTIKAITSGTLMFCGDSLSQYFEQSDSQSFSYNWQRGLRMTCIGICIGPTLHYWYGWLDKTVKYTGTKGAFIKLLYDQGIFAPVLLATLTCTIGIIEGKNRYQVKELMENNYIEALKLNYYIWPAAIFINFYFIPPSFRILYVSSLSMIWNAILSNITHRTNTPDMITISTNVLPEELIKE